MPNASFVRRAPEIAEEILAKMAILPKDLKSFTRNLLEKEASAQADSLKMPARMTIADLRKIAAGNKVDLPKVASVKAEEYGSVADGLRKMAERHAGETRDDVLALAVTILEKSAGAAAGGSVVRGGGFWKGVKSWVVPGSREFKARQLSGARHKRLLAEQEAHTPGTEASAEREWAAKTKREGEAAERASERWTGTAKSVAPSVALGIGVPMGASALTGTRGREKKVEIYK